MCHRNPTALTVALLCWTFLTPVAALGQTADAQDALSRSGPFGPAPPGGYQSYEEALRIDGQKVIANVPAYLWRHGCGPTAAAMVIGYYDGRAFHLLIPGYAGFQIEAVNQVITSTAHYLDYSLPIDPPPGPILADKSTLGGAHSPHNCLGDFMNTSWSLRENHYGWSRFNHVDDALRDYTNVYVNNTYSASYTATSWNEAWGTFTWEKFRDEIDHDRPLVLLVDALKPYGQTDHLVTAIGYRDTAGYPEYACFDTWERGVCWYRFRQISGSYPWGIYGATYYRVHGAGVASIVAWGWNGFGQCNVPAPNAAFVSVAGGGAHSLGLKADGSVLAWGNNYWGQCSVPAPNTDFVAIAAGLKHSLGVKAVRSIVAWGENFYGQCNVPAPNTGFVAVAAGYGHSLGLKADASIVAWGDNRYGQCKVLAPNMDFVAVAAGDNHSLGLKADGSIVAWGRNWAGQCNVPTPNTAFVAVAGGGAHSLGLKADASIVAWGDNEYGQCNVPAPNQDFVALAAGGHHSLALKADGSILAWGLNSDGQCNVPAPNTDFVAVAAGDFHSLALKAYRHPRGDPNCDGKINFDDIDPFVLALSGQAAYQAQYPNCNWYNADCNADGKVNFDDIDPFVALLGP